MKFSCLIVEDEPIAQSILKGYVKDVPDLEIFMVCDNAMDALSVLRSKHIDILFLDIEMPKISGLSFLKTLPNPPKTIITTAYRQFAVEGFELNVVDYLLKPFSFERFLVAVNRITKQEKKHTPSEELEKNSFFFKVDQKKVQVFLEDIYYIEALSNYVIIHLKEKQLVVYSSLTDIEKKLPSKQFIRIHRSYIVPIKNIEAFGKDYVEIGNKTLAIGNTYKKEFFKRLR
jgi:DNA-binding LytR/AlgR family response regulator